MRLTFSEQIAGSVSVPGITVTAFVGNLRKFVADDADFDEAIVIPGGIVTAEFDFQTVQSATSDHRSAPRHYHSHDYLPPYHSTHPAFSGP